MVSDNSNPNNNSKHKALLLGLGLDADDGHVRITRGKNFRLLGGSQDTHEQMQEHAIKFNEKLDQRGQRLEDVSRDDFVAMAHEVGMKVMPEDICNPKKEDS